MEYPRREQCHRRRRRANEGACPDGGDQPEADRGLDGGYRLGAGRRLPPLLLDDEEAVALVACLQMAALTGQDAVGEAGGKALAKLDQVLPPKLRALALALDDATSALPRPRPAVDLQVLSLPAVAQRDRTLVRFTYERPDGEPSAREVEPARLMTQGEHWYLQGYDRLRDDWRTFRLDRMSDVTATTWRFEPREAPPADFLRDVPSRYPCVVVMGMAVEPERLAGRIPAAYRDELEPTPTGCRFRVGAPTWDDLAWHMLGVSRELGAPLELNESPPAQEFRAALAHLADAARAV